MCLRNQRSLYQIAMIKSDLWPIEWGFVFSLQKLPEQKKQQQISLSTNCLLSIALCHLSRVTYHTGPHIHVSLSSLKYGCRPSINSLKHFIITKQSSEYIKQFGKTLEKDICLMATDISINLIPFIHTNQTLPTDKIGNFYCFY